jgi:type I restriction enzyme S subunit
VNEGLPRGWSSALLDELTDPGIDQRGPGGTEFTYVDIGTVDTRTKQIVEPKRLRPADAPSRARQRLRAHDVLVSMTRPNLNAVALVSEELDGAIASTGFHVLRAIEVEPRWLFCLVQTTDFVGAMTSLVQGALYPAVRPRDILAYRVPIAPLAEQRRVLAALEERLSKLDATVAALERVRARLPMYRSAVLQAACEGRLVPTETELARIEGREYESADALLEQVRASRPRSWRGKYTEAVCVAASTGAQVPPGWALCSLDELLRESLRNGHSAKSSGTGLGVRTLTLTAVTTGDFSEKNTKITSADPAQVRDLWLEPGDLLIERSNTPELVGTTRLYRGQGNFAVYPDLLIRARLTPLVVERYVEAVLMSPSSRQYLRRAAQGIAGSMPKIDQGVVKCVPVPLPPRAEQLRIVEEVDRCLSESDAVERAIRATLARADRMRHALLKHAFEGKLVFQNPNDEPADRLLERVREVLAARGSPRNRRAWARST